MNIEKSAISVSPNTDQGHIDEIKELLGVQHTTGIEIYLGLPTFSLRSKNIQFEYLRTRALKQIRGWSKNLFSLGGREILMKLVIQSIPTYTMSSFRVPVLLWQDQMVRRRMLLKVRILSVRQTCKQRRSHVTELMAIRDRAIFA